MKGSEQRLRALVQFLGRANAIELNDVKDVLEELTETRRTLSKVRSLLMRKPIEEIENDEAYDLVVALLNLFEVDTDE